MSTKLRFYSVNPEEEKRITIPKTLYDYLVFTRKISETQVLTITQYWLNVVSKPVRMRVRHTRDITSGYHLDTYEHTVKYPIGNGIDLEVTSELSIGQYDLIKSIVQNKDKDKKIRKYLTLSDFKLSGDYIVTADFKMDKPEEVVLEFEKTRDNSQPLVIPEYLLGGN